MRGKRASPCDLGRQLPQLHSAAFCVVCIWLSDKASEWYCRGSCPQDDVDFCCGACDDVRSAVMRDYAHSAVLSTRGSVWIFVLVTRGGGLPQAGHTQRNQANPTAGSPRQSLDIFDIVGSFVTGGARQ